MEGHSKFQVGREPKAEKDPLKTLSGREIPRRWGCKPKKENHFHGMGIMAMDMGISHNTFYK